MMWWMVLLALWTSDPVPVPQFLDGTWEATNISLVPEQEPEITRYTETMVAESDSVVRITAHGAGPNGEDLTRRVTFRERDGAVVMVQRDFEARGSRTANVLELEGEMDGAVYRFRLSLLGNHYVYAMETWREGRMRHSQISYLTRVAAR